MGELDTPRGPEEDEAREDAGEEVIDLLAGADPGDPDVEEGGRGASGKDHEEAGHGRRFRVVRRSRRSAKQEQRDAGGVTDQGGEVEAAEGADARYAWRCECGWMGSVQGDGTGLAVGMRHIQTHRSHGETYAITGLVDRITGELVLTGFDSTGFQRLFSFGKYGPKARSAVQASPVGAAGGGGGRGGRGNGKVSELPTRRLRVLADDIAVGDLVTVGFHLVARRIPELVPPILLADEATYRVALGHFLEDCVLVALAVLTELYPDRFSPQDVAMAVIAGEVQAQIDRLEKEA